MTNALLALKLLIPYQECQRNYLTQSIGKVANYAVIIIVLPKYTVFTNRVRVSNMDTFSCFTGDGWAPVSLVL